MSRGRGPVLLAVLCGLAVSLGVHALLVRWERARIESEFDRRAVEAAQAVSGGVEGSLDVLRALQAFAGAGEGVTEGTLRAFAAPLLERHPEIQALAWADPGGVVRFAEPPDGLRGSPLAGPEDLARSASALVATPPRDGGFRAVLAARGGYAAAVFRVERLLRTPLPEGVCLRVSDEEGVLFQSDPSAPVPGPHRTGSLGMGGRSWRFHLYPSPTFLDRERRATPEVGLTLGLLLTAVLALYLRSTLTRADRVEGLVAERTEQLRRAEERWQFALQGSGDGVWDWNLQTDAVWFSDRWKAMLGYAPGEIPHELRAWSMRVHPDDLSEVELAMDRHFRKESPEYSCELRMQAKDGSWKWILARGKVMAWTPEGKPLRMVGTHADITGRKRMEEELAHRATHDALTGLPNRVLWQEFLEKALARSRREEGRVAVLFVDLDGFKAVNDSRGHDAGDRLLVDVARRISSCLRDSDLVGRIGGDEFVAALPDLERAEDARPVGQKILEALAGSGVGASLGLAVFPDDAGDAEGLLKRADEAMYRAKQSGKGALMRWA